MEEFGEAIAMATFFVKFHIEPQNTNVQSAVVAKAYAYCWVVESTAVAAHNMAHFFVSKGEWGIKSIATEAVEVTERDFLGADIGQEQYAKAQEQGIAIVYVGIARDGKTTAGPSPAVEPRVFDLNGHIDHQKRLARSGRCLHFDSGNSCKEIISAHSIQKSGQLSTISDNGHVYAISTNIGSLKKNNGKLTLEKCGVGKVSTFFGFCKTHDNALFAPIDTLPLLPTEQQVFLYAYRSLCRELFVKEKALGTVDRQIGELPQGYFIAQFLGAMKLGSSLGLENLRRHKNEYDTSLRKEAYTGIEYTLFHSAQLPTMAFSGLLYPDFDFLGRALQTLGDHGTRLDLITMCSAPMKSGWGFLLAWHRSSSRVCREFVGSLAAAVHEGANAGDTLFRFVVSSCENFALSPTWWENLPAHHRDAVISRYNETANLFSPIQANYLLHGLEGISKWEFGSVISNVKH